MFLVFEKIYSCLFIPNCQKKKKKKEKKKEKRMKNGICVLFKSHTCTCISKRVEYSFAIFLFHAILGLDLQFKPLFFNFFLWYGKEYLKHTPLTALVLLREHKTRYIYKKERTN